MQPYGRGKMLGSGINPESFKQDYSGFTRAAEIQAQGMSNLGASIGGVIKDFGDAKKEQKKVDAYNKASVKAIEAAITLGGSYEITGAEETLRPFLEAYNDPNLSPIEKAALLDEGKGMIPNVFGRFDASQADAIQRAQIDARNAPSPRSANLQLGEIRETINGKPYDVKVTFDPATGETRRLDGSVVGAGFRDSAAIEAGLNLSFPQFESVPDGGVLNPLPNAIAAAAELTGGQSDISNVSPMPMETPTTTQTPMVDEIPAGQAGAGMIPPGATLVEEEKETYTLTSDQVNETISKGGSINVVGRDGNGDYIVKSETLKLSRDGQTIEFTDPDGKTVRITSGGGVDGKAPSIKLGEGEQLVADPNSPTGTKIVKIPSELVEKNKKDFSGYIEQMSDSYARLDEMGKAVSGGDANPLNFIESTGVGQNLSRMFGSEPQVLRDQINTMRPSIINVIRQASEMGAKGLDSEKELAFYLSALGDPTLPVEANIKALDVLDKVYGTGKAVSVMLKEYPELGKKVQKYNLKAPTEKTPATSRPFTVSPEAEDVFKRHPTGK